MRYVRDTVISAFQGRYREWAKEFRDTHYQEISWHNKLPGKLRYLSKLEVQAFVYLFCQEFKCAPIRGVYFVDKTPPRVSCRAYAWYTTGDETITIKAQRLIPARHVIHELTHHLGYYEHDKLFLEVEKEALDFSIKLLRELKDTGEKKNRNQIVRGSRNGTEQRYSVSC